MPCISVSIYQQTTSIPAQVQTARLCWVPVDDFYRYNANTDQWRIQRRMQTSRPDWANYGLYHFFFDADQLLLLKPWPRDNWAIRTFESQSFLVFSRETGLWQKFPHDMLSKWKNSILVLRVLKNESHLWEVLCSSIFRLFTTTGKGVMGSLAHYHFKDKWKVNCY